MTLLRELFILAGYLSSLVVILTGIWKTLVSISRQIQRRLDLRESHMLARQQVAVEKAHAEGLSEGYSYCMALVFAAMLVFIYYYAAAKSGSAQA